MKVIGSGLCPYCGGRKRVKEGRVLDTILVQTFSSPITYLSPPSISNNKILKCTLLVQWQMQTQPDPAHYCYYYDIVVVNDLLYV